MCRKIFRICVKGAKSSYIDYSQYLRTIFSRWLHLMEPHINIERLKQVMCLAKFYDCAPEEMKVYLMD